MTGLKLLGAALLVLCAGHASAICKWKDAKGGTQYSDAPPPGIECMDTIRAQPPISSGTSPAAPKSYQEKDMEFRKRRVEKQEAEKKAEQEKANEDAKRKNCEAAQARVAGLSRGGRVARYDSNGQVYYLGDDDIARELDAARKQAEQLCK
ncbi:MAG: DUF4124 domain-containing protein [Betaproteobacteria bacterium]